jgi:hypothetical protein
VVRRLSDPLIFINCRDRVKDLRRLVAWLERAGHQRIVLLDNASSYMPLLEYLKTTPHDVRWLGNNLGSRAVWNAKLVPNEPWVYTDPDILPTEDCPPDAVSYLAEVSERHPSYSKVALGLFLDDVPEGFPHLYWEQSLVSPQREIEPGVFDSYSDTTFALYRPNATFDLRALRTGAPHQARHMSWYVTEPDAEDAYYLARAIAGPLGSSWKGA